ncbi:MAG TPA: response regulator [Elusimicrobiota bacterium]|nr:response regulator [Elusimicrobiota bacterium]
MGENGNPQDPAKPLVLSVDDEVVVRELLKRYLPSLGFEVLVAESGEEALKYLEIAKPRIVLLDIHMPGMGGLETLRLIRQRAPEQLVIMLTAVQDEQIGQLAVRAGANDYLTKPIDLPVLAKALRTHLLFHS